LKDYFNSAKDDPENARRIINGTDKAKLIATHYTAFLAAIRASKADVMPSDVEPEMAKTDDIKPTDSGMVKSILATGAGGVGVSIMQSINNPWALIFAGLIASILAIGAWAYFTGRISFNRAK
jgi:putative chitinase